MNKEIEMLYKTIEAKDKIINEQALEIAKLKNQKQEAIKYIKEDMYVEPKELYGLVDGEAILKILGEKE